MSGTAPGRAKAAPPPRQPLTRALRAHLRRSGLLEGAARVVVAASGGRDSTVLLHLLRFARVLPRVELTAAHFDHAMRPGSAADAAWVRGLCRAWNVPLVEGRAALPPADEAAARAARYAFLEGAAGAAADTRIVTAHHADDQAETVLFRLLRGTGIAGLAGIRVRRGRVVRPLLPFAGDRIEAYARAVGLRWREDPTNVDPRHARNRLRAEVLPLLRDIRPGAAAALARIADEAAALEAAWTPVIARAERETATDTPEGGLQLAPSALLAYPSWVRARVMRRLFARLGVAPGRAGTLAALEFITSGASSGRVELPGGLRLERVRNGILLRREAPAQGLPDRPFVIGGPEPGRGEAVIGGRRLQVDWSPGEGARGRSEAFDPSALRFPLEVRARRPGDRVRLGYGTKKLKKLFAERRVERDARRRVPVVATADDRVVWVVGIARGEEARPVPGGPKLWITVADADEHDD